VGKGAEGVGVVQRLYAFHVNRCERLNVVENFDQIFPDRVPFCGSKVQPGQTGNFLDCGIVNFRHWASP
jgi:hypothetical protein